MAVDMFLKIDGVNGEAQDSKHKNEIDILSWSWGMTQSGTTHMGSGAGAGKVDVHDIMVTKYLDSSSPAVMQKCCNGQHFTKAMLTVRKAGGTNSVEYLKIEMDTVMISSVSTGAAGDLDRVTETVGLNFAKFTATYTMQNPDGSPGASIPVTWNIAQNTAS